ncbi:MAG: TSUP family transporter [Alphaproteobacteria bacterium]|nr:TSUP family transporter [Alphaproteobacteria bacterium]
MELSVSDLVAVAAIYVLAGSVKGAIGLGLPTVSMGLLGIWLPVEEAAAILVLPAILTNIWQSFAGGALMSLLSRLWPMLICLVLGTLLTAGIMTSGNTALTGAFLGTILVVYAGLVLAGYRFTVSRRAEPALGPAAGLTTGLISGATGIFVVPVAPYLEALNLGKDGLVQAIGLTALVATAALALGLGINGSLEVEVVIPGSIAVVAAFTGMFVGQRLRAKLSVDLFRRWVLIGLISLGIAMIFRAL